MMALKRLATIKMLRSMWHAMSTNAAANQRPPSVPNISIRKSTVTLITESKTQYAVLW